MLPYYYIGMAKKLNMCFMNERVCVYKICTKKNYACAVRQVPIDSSNIIIEQDLFMFKAHNSKCRMQRIRNELVL